jgi:general stress protein 26
MKELGLLKLNVGNKKRSMNYIQLDGKLYVITSKKSQKIVDLSTTNEVELSFGRTETCSATAHVIEDQTQVHTLFDTLTNADNNHFKKFRDDFVAIEFATA